MKDGVREMTAMIGHIIRKLSHKCLITNGPSWFNFAYVIEALIALRSKGICKRYFQGYYSHFCEQSLRLCRKRTVLPSLV